jgi:hypothetical protein
MSTMTAATTTTPAKPDFKAWLRTVGAKLRRAFELSGIPYMDGKMPPL